MKSYFFLSIFITFIFITAGCSDDGEEVEKNDNQNNENETMIENNQDSEEITESYSFDINADVNKDDPTVVEVLDLLEDLFYLDGTIYLETGEQGYDHILSYPLLSDRYDHVDPLIELSKYADENYQIENFELNYYNEVSDKYVDIVFEAPLYENDKFKYDLEIQAAILKAENARFIEFQDVRFD